MNLEQIDTSTTSGKAEVMRLAAEGRRVAAARRTKNGDEYAFSAVSHPSWNWEVCDFAIIAEPVGPEEVWLVVIDNGGIKGICETKDEADAFIGTSVRYIRADLAGEGE